MKKCEVFACPNLSVQIYQVAPGTLVWLCDECVKEIEIEAAKESVVYRNAERLPLLDLAVLEE